MLSSATTERPFTRICLVLSCSRRSIDCLSWLRCSSRSEMVSVNCTNKDHNIQHTQQTLSTFHGRLMSVLARFWRLYLQLQKPTSYINVKQILSLKKLKYQMSPDFVRFTLATFWVFILWQFGLCFFTWGTSTWYLCHLTLSWSLRLNFVDLRFVTLVFLTLAEWACALLRWWLYRLGFCYLGLGFCNIGDLSLAWLPWWFRLSLPWWLVTGVLSGKTQGFPHACSWVVAFPDQIRLIFGVRTAQVAIAWKYSRNNTKITH